jgi:D-serine deaminase-like pyridoxal phosphate-dependent protein
VSRRVQWLVHDRALLDDYLTFARERGLRLRINVEIDVGLHRGGARDRAELARLLDGIRRAPEHARFSGLMGYDGHVAIRGGVCRDLRAARLPEGCARVAAWLQTRKRCTPRMCSEPARSRATNPALGVW